MDPYFSSRTQWPVHPNILSQKTEELRDRGVSLLDLTVSNPTACDFRYLEPALLGSLTDPRNLLYEPDSLGLPEARQAVAAYYRDRKGLEISERRIFLTAGTSEAYGYIFRLLADAGDEILVPCPSYPLFDYLATLNDVKLRTYSLKRESGWGLDARDWEKKNFDRVRAVIMVHPNNPTGNFIRRKDLQLVTDFCREHGAALISDEVFSDFPLERSGAAEVASCGCVREILSFTLSGISKILGLPQMKVSWIAVNGPEDPVESAITRLEVIADTYLSVNTPSQRALAHWLAGQEPVTGEILSRLRGNYRFLKEKTAGSKIRVLPAEGGWYAVLQMPDSLSDEAWALRLLEREQVLVFPGFLFDFREDHFLVLSLLVPPGVMSEGVGRILRQTGQV